MNPLHATLIACRVEGRWAGVLLRGVSGVGKSTLTLNALRGGWRLVADDRVILWASGGVLFGKAPQTLRALVEARHLGVHAIAALDLSPVVAVVDLVADPPSDRVPQPATIKIDGITLALHRLHRDDVALLPKLTMIAAGSVATL